MVLFPARQTQVPAGLLAASGCSRVATHFDVDTVDSTVAVLGLGAVPNGLTGEQIRVVADVAAAADVMGLTIAEFSPRQIVHLHQVLSDFPRTRDELTLKQRGQVTYGQCRAPVRQR